MSESHFECILWDFGGIFTGSPFYSIDIYSAHLGVKSQELIELVLGYGLDVKKCSETGSSNVYYISPKSGNCVSYEVGRKFEKKLFIIPNCLKNNFMRFQTTEIEPCLEISSFFLQKISDTPKKFVFRNQIISMAHKEPFGLTPIEAFSIGTPAIFVDDGGFRDSIIDGECGRLLPRDDYTLWHEALEQCRDINLREKWATNGRNRIINLKLSPQEQAEKIHTLLQS